MVAVDGACFARFIGNTIGPKSYLSGETRRLVRRAFFAGVIRLDFLAGKIAVVVLVGGLLMLMRRQYLDTRSVDPNFNEWH